MKLKRWSRVEVFSKNEVPSGSWNPAVIIHGNGHYYTVKYDWVVGEETFHKVARKAIRPCPPVVPSLEDWASGHVAEVFHRFSWKMATVLRVLPKDMFLVRLIGSSDGIEVMKDDIRPRLCWQHDEWKLIGKGSNSCEERHNVPLKPTSICFKNSSIPVSNINCSRETPTIPSESLKRKLTIFQSQSKACALPSQKVRVIQNNGKQNRFISIHEFQLPEKVDSIASSRAMMVKKCTPPFNKKSTGFSRSYLGREKVDRADSIESSVASCSISGKKSVFTGYVEDNESSSDAESCCQIEPENGNSFVPAGKNLTEENEIHRIELLAYRSTVAALHASGPLSWEQETLLTNLRDSLHITNEEHLMEVRNLLSNNTSSPDS